VREEELQQAAVQPDDEHDITATATQDQRDQDDQAPRLGAIEPPNWGDPGEEDWGEGDEPWDEEGERIPTQLEVFDSLSLDQKVGFINDKLDSYEETLRILGSQPADFTNVPVAEVLRQRLDEWLERIDGVLQPQVAEGALQPEQVDELRTRIASLEGQIGDLLVRDITSDPAEAPVLEDSSGELSMSDNPMMDDLVQVYEENLNEYVEQRNRAELERLLADVVGEDGLEEMVDQFAEPDRYAKVQALKQKIQQALDRLSGGNAMSMVDPKDVGAGQRPNHAKPAAPPSTPGFTPPPSLPNRTVSPAIPPKLPHNTGHTPTKLDQRPLTSQQEETQQTSDRWEQINQAGRTTTKVLTYLTAGVFGLYALTQYVLAGIAGLVPKEVLQNTPGMTSRPTES